MVNLFLDTAFALFMKFTPKQSETPHLTRIAHLGFNPYKKPPSHLLLPDTVVWYSCFKYGVIIFRVWDYRLNHSICFSVDASVDWYEKFGVYFILSKALKLPF